MSPTNPPAETITFFYREKDLEQTQNLQTSNLYDSTLFNIPVGKVLYVVNYIENIINGKHYELERDDATFFLFDFDQTSVDTINFVFTTYGKTLNTRLINGTDVTFQIISGTGKYLNAKGTINYNVDFFSGIRTITLNIIY